MEVYANEEHLLLDVDWGDAPEALLLEISLLPRSMELPRAMAAFTAEVPSLSLEAPVWPICRGIDLYNCKTNIYYIYILSCCSFIFPCLEPP